jgi:hypothetical protein
LVGALNLAADLALATNQDLAVLSGRVWDDSITYAAEARVLTRSFRFKAGRIIQLIRHSLMTATLVDEAIGTVDLREEAVVRSRLINETLAKSGLINEDLAISTVINESLTEST